jgi:hypothetical protein
MALRINNASEASIDRNVVLAKGSFKVVYKGIYTKGQRAGEACVTKEMRSGSTWMNSAFDKEIEVVERTADIVDQFNDSGYINRRIQMNSPEVWRYADDCVSDGISGSYSLTEPFIENFQKFNSNSGWVLQDGQGWTKVMQVRRTLGC